MRTSMRNSGRRCWTPSSTGRIFPGQGGRSPVAQLPQELREGDRATADALGHGGGRQRRAPLHGGRHGGHPGRGLLCRPAERHHPHAVPAGYDRYLNEYNMSLQDLNAVNAGAAGLCQRYLDQLGQFNTDRNFAFNQYLSDFDILQNQLASLQGQDSVDYNRWMDKVGAVRAKAGGGKRTWPGPRWMPFWPPAEAPARIWWAPPGYGSEYVQALEEAYLAAGCPAGSRRRRSVQQFRRREVQDDADHGQTGSKRRRLFGRRSGCLAGERVYRRDAEGDLWIRAKQRRKRNDHRRLSAGGLRR